MSKYTLNPNNKTTSKYCFACVKNLNKYVIDKVSAHSFDATKPFSITFHNNSNIYPIASNYATTESVKSKIDVKTYKAEASVHNFLAFIHKVVKRSPEYTVADRNILLTIASPSDSSVGLYDGVLDEILFSGKMVKDLDDPFILFKCLPIINLLNVFSSFTIKIHEKCKTVIYTLTNTSSRGGQYLLTYDVKTTPLTPLYNYRVDYAITFGPLLDNNIMSSQRFLYIYRRYINTYMDTGAQFRYTNYQFDVTNKLTSVGYSEYWSSRDGSDTSLLSSPYFTSFDKYKNMYQGLLYTGIYFNVATGYKFAQRPAVYDFKPLDTYDRTEEIQGPISCFYNSTIYLVDGNNKINLNYHEYAFSKKYPKVLEKLNQLKKLIPYTLCFNYSDACRDLTVKEVYLVYKGKELVLDNKRSIVCEVNSPTNFYLDLSVKNIGRVERFLDSVLTQLQDYKIEDLVQLNKPAFITDVRQTVDFQTRVQNSELIENNLNKVNNLGEEFRFGEHLTTYLNYFVYITEQTSKVFKGSSCRSKNTLINLYTLKNIYFPNRKSLLEAFLTFVATSARSSLNNKLSNPYPNCITFDFLNPKQQSNLYIPRVGYFEEFVRKYQNDTRVLDMEFVYAIYYMYECFKPYLNFSSSIRPKLYITNSKSKADYYTKRDKLANMWLITSMSTNSKYFTALENRLYLRGIDYSIYN